MRFPLCALRVARCPLETIQRTQVGLCEVYANPTPHYQTAWKDLEPIVTPYFLGH
jgi:hypothetical protein